MSNSRELSKIFTTETDIVLEAEMITMVTSASSHVMQEAMTYTDNATPDLTPAIQAASAAAVAYTDSEIANLDLTSTIITASTAAVLTASAAAVDYLVGGAPGALNTLNELAAALGDNQDFATSITSDLASKLSISTASATYLTQSDATATYLTQSNAQNTYLTQSNANTTYLSQSNASATYLTQSDASTNYLSKSSASSTYLTQSNASNLYYLQTGGAITGGMSVSGSAQFASASVIGLASASPALYFGKSASVVGLYLESDDNGTLVFANSTGYKNIKAKDITATNDVISNSDIRLKKDIELINTPLEKVLALEGVTYKLIDGDDKTKIGLIAQQVEPIVPEVVIENDEGIKSINYQNLVALLIEAIKEQQSQIKELKEKLNGI